ncbi:MAG: AAA family ATPase [Gammaproteobacteria bacterium]|nr:AAA family ATPase [Gammaproteobacteria bacterium]
MKEIFTERHKTGTYSILQPNPLLNAGKDMYDCLTEKARRPLAPCRNCHERRYMDPTDGEDCSKCTKSRQRQMRFSDENDMDPGVQDESLRDLTYVEKWAIGMLTPSIHIVRLGNRPIKKGGNIITFPADLSQICMVLPRLPSELPVVYLKSASSPNVLKARRDKILNALIYLQSVEGSPYQRIQIDQGHLEAYPEVEGFVEGIRTVNIPEPEHVGPDIGPVHEAGLDDSQNSQENEDGVVDAETDPDQPHEPNMYESNHIGIERTPFTEQELLLRQLNDELSRVGDGPVQPPPPPPADHGDLPGQRADNPLPLPPRNFDQPANDLSSEYWTMAYPTLFPLNKANFGATRRIKVTIEEWIDHLLAYKDGRFNRNAHFLFNLHQFQLKHSTWKQATLYGDQTLTDYTRQALADTLSRGGNLAQDVINKVTRSAQSIPGSKAHCRREGNRGTSMMRFISKQTGNVEHFNVFLTLTSKEHHDNVFLASIEEGKRHLSKRVVASQDLIPADRQGIDYILPHVDTVERMRILNTHQPEYQLFFREKVDLFMQKVLIGVLGVKEYMVRFEFQARGGVHAHILLCVPLGLDRPLRREAFCPPNQTIDKMHAYVEAFLQQEPNATAHDMRVNAGMANLARELHGEPSEAALQRTIDIMKKKQMIIRRVYESLGITELHPSRDKSDRFVQHGGTMTVAPPVTCLRLDFDTRVDPARVRENLTNMTNKIHIHNCDRGNCQKETVVNGHRVSSCKMRFPRSLVGNRLATDQDNEQAGAAAVIRDNVPVPGKIAQVVSASGQRYTTAVWERDHLYTHSSQPDLFLIWDASIEVQYCHSEESVGMYLSKYISKVEPRSIAANDAILESYRLAAENSVTSFVRRVLREVALERDYAVTETAFHLLKLPLFVFSRQIVSVNVLGSVPIQQQPGSQDQVVSPDNYSTNWDSRHSQVGFIELQRQFQDDPDTHPNPEEISFYEYVSGYNKNWTPRAALAVPHLLPHFVSRPTEANDWLKKFLVCMIRAFNPHTPTLDVLTNQMTIEELTTWGNEFFHDPVVSCPQFARDLWSSDDCDYLLQRDAFDDGEGDLFPEHEPERIVHEDGVDPNVDEDLFFQEQYAQEQNQFDPRVFDAADNNSRDESVATDGYDYQADRLSLVPDWNEQTPENMRKARRGVPLPNNLEQGAPEVDYDRLNSGQKNLVDWILPKLRDLIAEVDPTARKANQFCLEVCGPAGSGKTTVFKVVKHLVGTHLTEINSQLSVGDVLRFAAPTGCAAKLLPTPHSTLHKLLHLPIHRSNSKDVALLSGTVLRGIQQELRNLRVLIIDEKSFIGAHYMFMLNSRLQQIFTSTLPFGGLSVVLMGDFAQLSPVGDHALFMPVGSWSVQQLAGHAAFTDNFTSVICLEASVRQGNDPAFRDLLQQMARGPLSDAQVEMLLERKFNCASNRQMFSDATLLAAFKKDYLAHNRNRIASLDTPKVLVRARNEPAAASREPSERANGLHNSLLLARGMKVMLTSNLDLSLGLTNGTVGTVVGILYFQDHDEQPDEIPEVLVHFPGYLGESVLPNHDHVYVVGAKQCTWLDSKGKEMSRWMNPLIPAYGMSIHKSQGQTLERVMLHLGTEFSAGLTYTALTRVRRVEDLLFYDGFNLTKERLLSYHGLKSFAPLVADMERKARMSRTTLGQPEPMEIDTVEA